MTIFGHRTYTRVVPPIVGGTRVYDEFTEAARTPLTAHTPDTDAVGGGWLLPSGSLDIYSLTNQARTNSGDGGWRYAEIDAGVSDYTISSDVYISGGSINGIAPHGCLLLCFQDTDNFLLCGLQVNNDSPSSNRLRVLQRVAGSYNDLGSVIYPYGGGYPKTATLEVIKTGTSADFTATIDGTPYNIPLTGILNSTLTTAGMTFKSSGIAICYLALDNFLIEA